LKELGCEILPIHCTPDGRFPHTPEPTFVNLQDLCRHTRESGADVGFAMDPDADRLAIVSEGGNFLGEELTLAMVVRYVLSRAGGDGAKVIINMSTSRATEDEARKAGAEVRRVPVGEVHVAEAMKESGATIGGEGNGGVIYPKVHYGRDAMVGMGIVLEMMARAGRPISAIAAELPKYHMIKAKEECPPALGRRAVRELARDTEGAVSVDTSDGLRVDWEDRWVHLRASNTEPVLRIIAEARTERDAAKLVETYSARIRRMIR
ncbi:MAG: phosphoglucosamine mutase, partial [Planctomycetota bacterium]|nr:phosphoglucosamine mutase [Planctomycetota bacterium]